MSGCEHDDRRQCASCRKAAVREAARKYARTEKGKAKLAKWRQANREKYLMYEHKNAAKNKGHAASWFPEGVTIQRMHEEQAGRCAICARMLGPGRHTNVDHCHTTGKVRGLLCHKCNNGLGRFEDSIDSLKAAIQYLEKHK